MAQNSLSLAASRPFAKVWPSIIVFCHADPLQTILALQFPHIYICGMVGCHQYQVLPVMYHEVEHYL
jgi:hypothetical protein